MEEIKPESCLDANETFPPNAVFYHAQGHKLASSIKQRLFARVALYQISCNSPAKTKEGKKCASIRR